MMRPTITSSYRDPTNFHEEAFKIPTTASPAALTLELGKFYNANIIFLSLRLFVFFGFFFKK